MTTVYLIRHCETVANEIHLLQGSLDYPLSERGRSQLEYLKTRFADVYLDAIYSSPQGRAIHTAEAVRGEHNMKILTDNGLCEINCGRYEGERLAEHFKKDPALEHRWKNQPHLLNLEGGESATAVYERATAAIKRIAAQNPDKTVAVASHGFAIRCVLSYFQFGCLERLAEVEIPGNTSVSKIEFFEDGTHKIMFANDSDHLPDTLKTYFNAK